jgi:predicted nucleic acid-binding protein
MPAGPVVLNNTPLVALWAIGRLDLLRDLFKEVLIPQEVEQEFLAIDEATRGQALAASSWIKTVQLSKARKAVAYVGLDPGEAAALAVAEERDARLIVLDDKRARQFAERMGIPVTGTLGVLLRAKQAGLIESVANPIRQLMEVGLFLSPALVRQALRIADEET